MDRSWVRLALPLVIGSILSAGVVAVIVFSDSTDSDPNASITGTGGAGGGPDFVQPSRVTEGDWEPPGVRNLPTPDPQERPLKAKHVGEVVNGIRIADFGETVTSPCPGEQRKSGEPLPFEVKYLPPNTFEIARPSVFVCPDGELAGAGRSFQIGDQGGLAVFVISYSASEPIAYGWGDYTAMTINGWPSVAIDSVKNNGAAVGGAVVVMDTPNGFLEVTGTIMPLDELIKIAEGISCTTC
jgi:hypothetical protein